MFYYFDNYYLYLVIPATIIALIAQLNVKSAFSKYSKLYNNRGYTGYEIARKILDQNGLYDVTIEKVAGSLTDHFDPTAKVVRLSETVYNSTSVAAIGVAAHEVGHAIQYNVGYFPIKIRMAIVPITNIGSTLAIPLTIMGIVFSFSFLINIGIWLFIIVVVFQLITLPVEFNASSRALKTIREQNILETQKEYNGAKRMLQAAALTYVASLIVAVANLLRLIALANRNNRN